QHAGRLRRRMRLEAGIFGKGRAGFLRLGQAEFAGRDQFQPEGLEQFLEFLQLAGIVGGKDEAIAFAEFCNAHLAPPSSARRMSCQMTQSRSEKAPSPAGFAVDLSPRGRGDVVANAMPSSALPEGRGRCAAAGEGAFLLLKSIMLQAPPAASRSVRQCPARPKP